MFKTALSFISLILVLLSESLPNRPLIICVFYLIRAEYLFHTTELESIKQQTINDYFIEEIN